VASPIPPIRRSIGASSEANPALWMLVPMPPQQFHLPTLQGLELFLDSNFGNPVREPETAHTDTADVIRV
jgi:hypothetical protein